jgi:hypothetical protein
LQQQQKIDPSLDVSGRGKFEVTFVHTEITGIGEFRFKVCSLLQLYDPKTADETKVKGERNPDQNECRLDDLPIELGSAGP